MVAIDHRAQTGAVQLVTAASGLERVADSFGTAELGSWVTALAAMDNTLAVAGRRVENNWAENSLAGSRSAGDSFAENRLAVCKVADVSAVGKRAADM